MNDGSCWSRASPGSARRRWPPRSRARRSRTARSWCTGAATRTSASRTSRGPRCSPTSSAHAPDDVLAAHVDARGQRAGAARARARSPRAGPARLVERRRVGAVPAVRCGRRPAGSGVGAGTARARARRPALGGPSDGPAPASRRVGRCAAATARDRHVPRLRPRRRSPARRGARRAAPGAGASSGSRCAASATTSSSPCSRRLPATRWPKTASPCATRCWPRPTATRSSSVRCSGTSPRPGPSIRTSTAAGSPSQDLRTSGLPVSIREVIGQRVARLGAPTRDALSLAAVIGRDFDAEVLARVAELDEDTRHRSVRPGRRRGGAHRGRPWRAGTRSRTR